MVEERFFSDEGPGGRESVVTVFDTPRAGISWPAIFAGALAALMAMLILNMIAAGIGLTSFNLVTDRDPLQGVAGGLGWAVVIIELISVAFGGWVAGRVAGGYRLAGGFLHGALSWALVTLFSLWLLGSAAGSVISGVGSAIGTGLNAAAQGIGALAPAASEAVQQATGNLDLNTQDLRTDLMALLTGTPAATPAGAPAGAQPAGAPTSDAFAQAQARTTLNEIFTSGEPPFSPANKERMITLLTERSNLTDAQATELVNGWEQDYTRAQAAVDQAKQQVTEAADEARKVVSRVALLGALGLIVGALLAGWMGTVGARGRASATTTVR
jgi:hypothetical protein